MKKYILIEYPQHFWGCFDLEEYIDGVLNRIIELNKYCEVNGDFIIEYDAEGGSGIGWKKGEVIKKISIKGAEFEKVKSYKKIYSWDREKHGLPIPKEELKKKLSQVPLPKD